jgi:C-terminal processing protease CtpA/Prc
MKRISAALCVITVLFLASCKKSIDDGSTTPPPPVDSTANPTPEDLVKDTVLLIARDVYLWNTQIPSDFDARSYADPIAEMDAIRQYSIEPGFANPVDRYSFAIKQTDWDNLSNGIEQDFGMSVFFNTGTDLRVKYAEQASPAGLAGIERGWQIIKINGNSQINTSEASVNMIVNAVFYSSNTSFTFKKPDGSTVDISLTAATYQSHPIFADSVYAANGKKVGYLALNSFLGDTTEIYSEFGSIFNNFQSQNVNEVIVDLRYNGGGYVSMAEKLANYLVPTAGNNQVMYKQTFNANYSSYNETTVYHKLGSLNVDKIFFIVSDNTASASELLINSLKPFVSETLVGPSDTTYGKPVGFFPIPAGEWYAFPISFRTVNKDGNGNYFGGFKVDHPTDDGLDKNWGDVDENCLKSILTYIKTGTFGFAHTGSTNISNGTINTTFNTAANKTLETRTFKGAVGKTKFVR